MAELDCLEDQGLKDGLKSVLVKVHNVVHVTEPMRPRKRLRLSEISRAQASITAGQSLIQRIYTLLGVPTASGLEGLNQLAL